NGYISEFESIYNGEPWYGKSLMSVVQSADAQKAFKKPGQQGHSAWEIAHHLFAWKNLLVKRLNGQKGVSIDVDSNEDWAPAPKELNGQSWNSMVKQLEQNQKDLIKALSKSKDEDLDKDFAGTGYS